MVVNRNLRVGFYTFSIVYLYMFGLGFIISAIISNFQPRYYFFNIWNGLVFVTITYIFILIGYHIFKKINFIYIKGDFIDFNPELRAFLSLFIGFILFFERIIKLSFKPFWIYGSNINFIESGYVGIGLLVLSISLGLDILVNKKTKFIKFLIFIKIITLVFYGRSRGAIIWIPLIFIFKYFLNNSKQLHINKIFSLALVIIIPFLGYRFYPVFLNTSNVDIYTLLFDLAPEFKDFNNYVSIVTNKYIDYTNTRLDLFYSYFLDILPESILNHIGISKYNNVFVDLGKYNHFIVYGSSHSGVRLTILQDFIIFSNGNRIIYYLLCIFLGGFIAYLDNSKYRNILYVLLLLNLVISSLFHLQAFFFRIYPIIIVFIIYNNVTLISNKELKI